MGIYASPNFWDHSVSWKKDDDHDKGKLADCPLWVAHWKVKEPSLPEMWSRSGKSWAVWQYTSEGSVDGIKGNVDMDYATRNFFT